MTDGARNTIIAIASAVGILSAIGGDRLSVQDRLARLEERLNTVSIEVHELHEAMVKEKLRNEK